VKEPQITKEAVIAELKRVSLELGKTPGIKAFSDCTGIPRDWWLGVYWPNWAALLREAELEANDWNERFSTDVLLRKLAGLYLVHGHVLTKPELKILRRSDPSLPHPDTLIRHFGGRDGMVGKLAELGRSDPNYSGLLAILPTVRKVTSVGPANVKYGWVYLLKSGQHYKIGRSDTLERRIKQISVSLPEKVTLDHAIETDDPVGIEAYWHSRFASKRLNGEWFNLTPEDVKAFKRRKFQ
jgi:hypothetical protein